MTHDPNETTPSGDINSGTQGSDPGDCAGMDPADGSSVSLSVEELEELKKRCDEREAYRSELLRSRADFENYQKRVRKERPQLDDQAVRRFLKDLLPVCDNLERALAAGTTATDPQALHEGVRLTHQLLVQVLESHGVLPIEVGPGFDPEVHEAVGTIDSREAPTGAIAEVLEKGYRHKDTVLRPSRVVVARNIADLPPSDSQTDSSPSE